MCPPCDNEMKSEAIVEHLCASEFGKKEHSRHAKASQVGTGQHGSCVGSIGTATFPCPWLCPQGQARVPLDVSVGMRRWVLGGDWTGWVGMCPAPTAERTQGQRWKVLVAVPIPCMAPAAVQGISPAPPGKMCGTRPPSVGSLTGALMLLSVTGAGRDPELGTLGWGWGKSCSVGSLVILGWREVFNSTLVFQLLCACRNDA